MLDELTSFSINFVFLENKIHSWMYTLSLPGSPSLAFLGIVPGTKFQGDLRLPVRCSWSYKPFVRNAVFSSICFCGPMIIYFNHGV